VAAYNTSLSKKFTGLPAHWSIKIVVDIYFVDSWDNEFFSIYVDYETRKTVNPIHTNGPSNICGGGWNEWI